MGKQIERCRGLQLTISGPPSGGKPAWKGKRKGGAGKGVRSSRKAPRATK
jgi:DNA topoisomerase-3